MLESIRRFILWRMLGTFSVFIMCALARCIEMKPFYVMRVFNVCFNKFPALSYTLVLVLIRIRSMFVTLPDAGSNIIGDKFHQGIRGTIRQGFIRFSNCGLHFACRFQPGEGCTFTCPMDPYKCDKKLIFCYVCVFLSLGAECLCKGRTNLFFILLFYPLEYRGDILGV